MKTLLFILIATTCYAQNVRRVTNLARLNEIVYQNGNRMIIPVVDGAGNLIISVECIDDPAFARIRATLLEITTVMRYVPLPEDEVQLRTYLEDLDSRGELPKYDAETRELEYKGERIPATRDTTTRDTTRTTTEPVIRLRKQ